MSQAITIGNYQKTMLKNIGLLWEVRRLFTELLPIPLQQKKIL
ncbi:hypothetical protein [Terrilactibacillus tamarindi]|nr:hypothetical protein [Terrilactibacillus tamarindi]